LLVFIRKDDLLFGSSWIFSRKNSTELMLFVHVNADSLYWLLDSVMMLKQGQFVMIGIVAISKGQLRKFAGFESYIVL